LPHAFCDPEPRTQLEDKDMHSSIKRQRGFFAVGAGLALMFAGIFGVGVATSVQDAPADQASVQAQAAQ
jgi:hypothetical protein